ncbi:hypothetical protein [uncultured Gammaproteobacteria bacterium]|nr:hypothetical protein [uncultured Gammaproteobacteria bacterium]CAC9563283.1 hypothetical protein [uncultured Gammaproteobacteria bacterium]CAC9564344.1 hypothetical protein [uncultured Gammaproteobacteria bacterium]CAC9578019.1 hypothetical protein [uncultured Gammaproteobacteria bacterium]CAC9960418.1 hypothetical protein [uncultured Gammaproteobacteria bacterium]
MIVKLNIIISAILMGFESFGCFEWWKNGLWIVLLKSD